MNFEFVLENMHDAKSQSTAIENQTFSKYFPCKKSFLKAIDGALFETKVQVS